MTKWQARVRDLTPAVAALFFTSIAAPHAALVYHVHAGGDLFHVHAEDLDGAPHDHDHDHHHEHHLHAAGAHPHEMAIEATDAPELGHWHTQSRFHRTVAPAVFVGQHAEPVRVVHFLPKRPVVDRPALSVRVRGPPRTA